MIKREIISSKKVASSPSPLSQGIKVGNFIFLSGQIGRNPDTEELEKGFIDQARRVLQNIKELLNTVNSSMDRVIKVTIFLKDMNNFKDLDVIYKEFFAEPFPCQTAVEISALARGAKIEIDIISICD